MYAPHIACSGRTLWRHVGRQLHPLACDCVCTHGSSRKKAAGQGKICGRDKVSLAIFVHHLLSRQGRRPSIWFVPSGRPCLYRQHSIYPAVSDPRAIGSLGYRPGSNAPVIGPSSPGEHIYCLCVDPRELRWPRDGAQSTTTTALFFLIERI
jgi:hypothetical protein